MTPYAVEKFLEKFDEWVDGTQKPNDDLRRAVLAWLFTRPEKPYDGVKRGDGFDNLWYGAVPGTQHGSGQVVVCSYWIYEADHLLRCESFSILSMPI